MSQILFVFGRPGSGKSQVARCLKNDELRPEYQVESPACLQDWSIFHITDYTFLQKMFIDEVLMGSKRPRFRATGSGGFNVLNFSVLPQALQLVNARALHYLQKRNTLTVIEFARSAYTNRDVWRHFSYDILHNASFLYLHADLDLCIQRVVQRAAYPLYIDDQYVSELIMRGYYGHTQEHGPLASLQRRFGEERVMAVDNNGQWRETWYEVEQFLRVVSARTVRPLVPLTA